MISEMADRTLRSSSLAFMYRDPRCGIMIKDSEP